MKMFIAFLPSTIATKANCAMANTPSEAYSIYGKRFCAQLGYGYEGEWNILPDGRALAIGKKVPPGVFLKLEPLGDDNFAVNTHAISDGQIVSRYFAELRLYKEGILIEEPWQVGNWFFTENCK